MPPTKQIEQIIDKVRRREQVLEPLFERMDEDYSTWNLTPFTVSQQEGIGQENAFTDNQPRVDADKIINFISSAERIVRIENDNEAQQGRDSNNNAERLIIGMLHEADRRLEYALKPVLQSALGWHAVVRGGWVCARALLLKNPDGSTKVDVWPLDPRQTMMVANQDGPIWAAHVNERTRAEIRDQYPKFRFHDEDNTKEDADDNEKVIDYYWKTTLKNGEIRFMNGVIIDEQWAKKPANTFSERFPIVFRLVGANPGVSPFSILDSGGMSKELAGIRDVGESFFAPNRTIYDFNNRAWSYRMALQARAVQGIKKVYSRGGAKSLEGGEDEAGGQILLDVDNAEEVDLMPIPQLTKDADALVQHTQGSLAKGGLTDLAHGGLPAPVSGRALQLLRSAIGEKLNPYLTAVQSCITGVAENLISQFETGRYEPIRVSGRTRSREEFSREVSSDDIADHGPLAVRLRAQLPEDVLEKWSVAQIASQRDPITKESLASPQFTRDEILDMQDGDFETTRQMAHLSRISSPIMLLMTQWEAARAQEDYDTADFYAVQIQRALEQQEFEHIARILSISQAFGLPPDQLMRLIGGGGGQGGPNGNGSQRSPTSGLRPQGSPLSGTAFGRPQPSPEAGTNTANERPGSRSEEEQRANAIGLTIARS